MAILLVHDEDNTNPDPIKSERGCYKRGYVVAVYEDGTPCVIPPQPPFLILKVKGLTKIDAEKYVQPETALASDGKQELRIRRRAFRILVENLSIKDRYLEVDFEELKPFIENVTTGIKENG